MNKRKNINKKNDRRKARARARLTGTAQRPRLSVFKSNLYVYVQAIDDAAHATLLQASSLTDKELKGIGKTELAEKIGTLIASRMKEKKIASAIFDRGLYQYHGFMKNLADAIRKNGIRI